MKKKIGEPKKSFFEFSNYDLSDSCDDTSELELESEPPSPHCVFVNTSNDPNMSYLLDDENFFPQSQDNQTNDGFHQPQPEDEAMGTQVPCDPIKPMENQPSPVGILYDDTSHHYMNDLVFPNPEDAKSWARQHAQKDMCVLVLNGRESKTRFEMVCERSCDPDKSHKRKGYVYKGKTNRKNKTFSKKINCPFKLAFNYNEDKGGWVLCRVMQGCHNHPRPEHLEGHFMAAKLTPKEMDKVAKMRTMGISPVQMLQILKEDNKDNHSSLSTIYNSIETIRRNGEIDK
ncbi:uncharacterized protein LOC113333967 [Papaver somniferum]|uniref:uncharacterized protein LOC113333967 n=1 Tax=Papaver somniferum TaxID=3469 RepID=UPI000E6F50CF|nr:uncharacterized protein LOC113333967 [Papaver somniferum]